MDRIALAEAFALRFEGLDRVYGRYTVPDGARADARGKLQGDARTHHGAITTELWLEHLDGRTGLGVVPITDDATARFGAIDVDAYPLDLKELRERVAKLGLPLVTCRTKSGGAHLYLFLSEFAPAELVRARLMEFATALGYPSSEVFPKQTKLASEKDEGSWINVPYFAGKRTTRYALGDDGASLGPDDFIPYATSRAVSADELRAVVVPEHDDDRLSGAPPCLVALSQKGFPEGTRNNALFNVGVYLRKRYQDDWADRLDAYNRDFMDPPLGHQEVSGIVKSIRRKDYSYRCKDQPICGACNRAVCLTRPYGVGGGTDDPGVVFGPIVKLNTDPPTWLWDVDGMRLELTTEELMTQRKFHAIAIDRLNKWPNLVKPETWKGMVADRLSCVEELTVPDDATREGQMWVHLGRFCTSRAAGRALDDLLIGRPFTEHGRTFFCAADFIQYLHQHRVSGVTEKQMYAWLRRRGVEHHFRKLKGKGLNFWSVPAFEEQTEEHEVPVRRVEGAM